jgi:hypothetical protein
MTWDVYHLLVAVTLLSIKLLGTDNYPHSKGSCSSLLGTEDAAGRCCDMLCLLSTWLTCTSCNLIAPIGGHKEHK